MDEHVLSIDLADHPSPIVLVRSRGEEVTVVERDCLDLSGLLTGAAHGELSSTERLRSILAKAEQVLATTIVVVPPPHLIALNVRLPPAKQGERAGAIQMFLEDTLPFEIEEYLFNWHRLPRTPTDKVGDDSSSDSRLSQEHHIAGVPHLFVGHIVDSCRAVGLEPHIICPPSTALGGALTYLSVEESPVIVLRCAEDGLYQLLGVEGNPYYQRFIPQCQPQDHDRITRETLALSLWAKRHLGVSAQLVYTVGPTPPLTLPSLPVRAAPLTTAQQSLADLAARAYFNREADGLLTNLRAGELALNPLVIRLIQSLPSIARSLVFAIIAIAASVAVIYFVRETKITQLEEELFTRVKEILPSTNVILGQEGLALKTENEGLNRQLSDLSSAITISPIDALTTVFRDLSESKMISLSSLELIGKAIKIKGTSQNYAEIEKLENALRKKQTKSRKQVYCRIKKELPPSGRSDKVAFRFELRICNVD